MKHILFLLFAALPLLPAAAQEAGTRTVLAEGGASPAAADSSVVAAGLPADAAGLPVGVADSSVVAAGLPADAAGLPVGVAADSVALAPVLPLPAFAMSAPGLDGTAPWDYGLYGPSWRLHEGFNAQLSMSLSAAFGHDAPRGVGFGQSAAFAYAKPLTGRLSVAAGVYAAHMDWGAFRRTEGGVAGVVGYRVTDAFSIYAYGAKRFLPKDDFRRHGPFPLFLAEPKERVGAMAELKLGHRAMIQVSVEHGSY